MKQLMVSTVCIQSKSSSSQLVHYYLNFGSSLFTEQVGMEVKL